MLLLPYKIFYFMAFSRTRERVGILLCLLTVPFFYLTGLFSHLFIVHSKNTSRPQSVCRQGANNHTILYLYSLFIYIANEVTQSVRQSMVDLFSYEGHRSSETLSSRIITLPLRTFCRYFLLHKLWNLLYHDLFSNN